MRALISRTRRFVMVNRKRKIATLFVIGGLLSGGTAMAAYILSMTGEGEKSGTLATAGNAAATVTVQVNLDGLAPGDSVPYTVNAKDPTAGGSGGQVKVAPTMQVTTSDPVNCAPSNFSVAPNAMSYPVAVPAYPAMPVKVGEGTFTFVNSGNQNGCSGKTVTLKAVL